MRWGCATLRRLLLNLPSKTYFYAGKQATIITFEHNFIRASCRCQNQSRLPRWTRRSCRRRGRRGRRRRCLVLTGWWRWDCRLSICTRLSGIGIGNVFATASGTGTGTGAGTHLTLPSPPATGIDACIVLYCAPLSRILLWCMAHGK